ncbi:MAG: ABC transporter ATP-binding protein [Ruminococcaceae bacterium]|nr:ABC transporter ATP-binding protein [Oscillospiraceae bacterium]
MISADYISSILFDNKLDKNSYLNNLPIIKYLSREKELCFSSNVTFFVGENGTGKSTLLEAIAVAYGFNAEGGSKNFTFSTNATHSELFEHITVAKRGYAKDGFFLRAESLYNVATNIEQMDSEEFEFVEPPMVIEGYGGISLHDQSHGESFLSIVQNRFFGNGLYILDEPEAALSPKRLLTLMTEIDYLVKKDSQFIIATHSPILMAFPNAKILEFSQNGIESVNYQDTEHFQITKRFLNNPEKMLHYLLNGNDI